MPNDKFTSRPDSDDGPVCLSGLPEKEVQQIALDSYQQLLAVAGHSDPDIAVFEQALRRDDAAGAVRL